MVFLSSPRHRILLCRLGAYQVFFWQFNLDPFGHYPDLTALSNLIDAEEKLRWVRKVLLSHGDATVVTAEMRSEGCDLVRSVLIGNHLHLISCCVSNCHLPTN